MFKELYAVARHTPFTMIVTPLGERLSVIIQPRPTGDAEDRKGFAAPIKAVGTPDELDAELPGKLTEYAARVNDVRAAIDLPIEAVDSEKAKSSKKEERSKKRADAKKKKEADLAAKRKDQADRKAKRKTEEAARKKASADKRAKTMAEKKKAKGISLPGATSPAKPAAKPAATPSATRPGKPECIADYRTLLEKHGADLTRRKFVKEAATGRRYEKLWKNWEEFIAAAAQGELPLGEARQQGPAANATQRAGSATEGTASAGTAGSANAGSIPAGSSTDPKPFKVYDSAGKVLCASKHDYAIGEKLDIPGRNFPYRIEFRNGHGGYTARMILPAKKKFEDESGAELGDTEGVYANGDKVVELGADRDFRIVEVTMEAYRVRDFSAPRWTVWNAAGEELGAIDAEPALGSKIDVGVHRDLTVILVDGQDVTATAVAKPRKPALAAAAQE